jgi:hypothetical protein
MNQRSSYRAFVLPVKELAVLPGWIGWIGGIDSFRA